MQAGVSHVAAIRSLADKAQASFDHGFCFVHLGTTSKLLVVGRTYFAS